MKAFIASALVLLGLSTSAVALQRYDVRVINATSGVISNVYARNLATDEVSDDLLGSTVIPAGEFKTLRLSDGSGTCNWRIQAKLADGRTASRNINVCTLVSWTVTE